MLDDTHAAEVLEVAASTATLSTRAVALVACIERWVEVDAVWLAVGDPTWSVHRTIASSGLDASVLDLLGRAEVTRDIQLLAGRHDGRPSMITELPLGPDGVRTWTHCLVPAGFRDALNVPLHEPGGPCLGMLTLLFADHPPPPTAWRDSLGHIAPLIARAVSATRALLDTARLVDGASSGAVLLRDGGLCPLEGFAGHPILEGGSEAVEVARDMLLAGHTYRSFLWPLADPDRTTTYARLTALSAPDDPDFLLGTLLITPQTPCDLTARELDVLGLVVEGASNGQIARRLFVSGRTVATHVEHILQKLDVPTRTLAAVRAEREGWYVPRQTRQDRSVAT